MAQTPGEHRQLLAILIGDIVAYSRLMATKEADTYYRIKELQRSVIVPAVERNRGRIVKWTGDGFIATFASAVDAVRTAVEIQSGSAAAGANAPEDLRIHFRIGINVGDVIVTPDDVFGDAVNVAARLQTAAAPDGICVSRGVRDAASGKVGIEFENRGELAVKNIPEPVGAYGVVFDPVAWTMEPPRPPVRMPTRRGWLAASAAVVLLTALAGLGWLVLRRSGITSLLDAPDPLRQRLLAAVPGTTPRVLEARIRAYEQAERHKALAASALPAGSWLTGNRASSEEAGVAVLESCQIVYGSPCVLVAVDATVQPAPLSARDMARVRYSGTFDPEQIPAASAATRRNREVTGYASAPAPKAAAYTPVGGRIFLVTGRDGQRPAEEQALAACMADPIRTRFNGPCFLYAVADQVVLPLRRREPFTRLSGSP